MTAIDEAGTDVKLDIKTHPFEGFDHVISIHEKALNSQFKSYFNWCNSPMFGTKSSVQRPCIHLCPKKSGMNFLSLIFLTLVINLDLLKNMMMGTSRFFIKRIRSSA